MSRALREIAEPFVAAAPAGARVRARLRVSEQDEAVLRAVGRHLGSLAGRDLAARCAEGRLGAKGKAESRRERKRALTAESSSRWAGAITRTSEDAWQLASRNLAAGRAALAARVRKIEARLAVQAGEKRGRTAGYATPAERHAKTIRLKALRARLARAGQRTGAGAVSVTRGGRRLMRARLNLQEAGLTPDEWRQRWQAARLFITADGEKGKPFGNETLRWNPGEGWFEVRLPAPLARLANRPHGRCRLSAPVQFTHRGGEVAAQAESGAVRYDVSCDPDRGRWYLDASWKAPARPVPSLDDLAAAPVVAVDVNDGHLAVAVVAPDGNVTGTPFTATLRLAGLPAATRDGRLRAAVTRLIATAKLRDRLIQMTSNAGLSVVVVDAAYTSRWSAVYRLPLLREQHPETAGHHAAAVVIGRRGLGHRARTRVNRNRAAPEDAARPASARTRNPPETGPSPRKPSVPRGRRQPPGGKTGRPHRTTAGNQAAQDRSAPPTGQYSLLRGG